MTQKITLLVLTCLWLLAACASPTGAPVSEAPTDIPTMAPSPVPATSTAAPTVAPTRTSAPTPAFKRFPNIGCCRDRAIEAGNYMLPSWMKLPLTLDVGQGWGVMNESPARLFLLAGEGRNELGDPSQVLVFIPIPDADAQEVLASIYDAPELTPAGEISETEIAGFPGWQFDARANPNPSNQGVPANSIPAGSQSLPSVGNYFAPGFLWTTWSAQPRLRFIALDMEEQVLLLLIESPPAEFEAFAGQAEEVLQSLKP